MQLMFIKKRRRLSAIEEIEYKSIQERLDSVAPDNSRREFTLPDGRELERKYDLLHGGDE